MYSKWLNPNKIANLGREQRNFEELVLAGAPGFEPGNGGTKNRCLTTWRRPNAIE